jgi:hypothetical protein
MKRWLESIQFNRSNFSALCKIFVHREHWCREHNTESIKIRATLISSLSASLFICIKITLALIPGSLTILLAKGKERNLRKDSLFSFLEAGGGKILPLTRLMSILPYKQQQHIHTYICLFPLSPTCTFHSSPIPNIYDKKLLLLLDYLQ